MIHHNFFIQSVGVGIGTAYPNQFRSSVNPVLQMFSFVSDFASSGGGSLLNPTYENVFNVKKFNNYPFFFAPTAIPSTIGPDTAVTLPIPPPNSSGAGVSVANMDEEKTVILSDAQAGDGILYVEFAQENIDSAYLPILVFADGESNEKTVKGIFQFMRVRRVGGGLTNAIQCDVSAAPSLGGNFFPAALDMPITDGAGVSTLVSNMGESRTFSCSNMQAGSGKLFIEISQNGTRWQSYQLFQDGENRWGWDPNRVYLYVRVRRQGVSVAGSPKVYIGGENATTREGGA